MCIPCLSSLGRPAGLLFVSRPPRSLEGRGNKDLVNLGCGPLSWCQGGMLQYSKFDKAPPLRPHRAGQKSSMC